MTGANRIILNQATILQAMQLWLAHEFKSPPTAVTLAPNNGDGSFTLYVKEAEKAKT
jgi:hypothetical protein